MSRTRAGGCPARAVRCVVAVLAVLTALAALAGPVPDARVMLAGEGACAYPAPRIPETPWWLRRLLLAQLWRSTRGGGVRVAVIDTGVDARNPQLAGAVDAHDGVDLIDPAGNGTDDPVGHGTEVAGIIAARPQPGSGLVGLAPEAEIIPVRQNDDQGGGTADSLAVAVRRAVDAGASVINISQDTAAGTDPALADAVRWALSKDVVVVAAAGNDGAHGTRHTVYPAAYPGVLAVGASDRSGRRAPFSQEGGWVGVLAPGVGMASTVPVAGQCVDSGTSFSAPYVAGVAALIRAKHPDWTQGQVVAQIERTARRTRPGRDDADGWGVADPVRALTDDAAPPDGFSPGPGAVATGADAAARPEPASLEGPGRQRAERTVSYVVLGGVLVLALGAGAAVTVRDAGRRRRAAGPGGSGTVAGAGRGR